MVKGEDTRCGDGTTQAPGPCTGRGSLVARAQRGPERLGLLSSCPAPGRPGYAPGLLPTLQNGSCPHTWRSSLQLPVAFLRGLRQAPAAEPRADSCRRAGFP